MVYDDGSKGSIVTEQFGKELSVIFKDGDSLLMNHHCNAGNLPHLKLKESNQPGVWEFETFKVSNLSTPDANHVKKILYKFIDEKSLDLELVWKMDQAEVSEKYSLTKL